MSAVGRLALLVSANLANADLIGANLTNAYLVSANLRGADLRLWLAALTLVPQRFRTVSPSTSEAKDSFAGLFRRSCISMVLPPCYPRL